MPALLVLADAPESFTLSQGVASSWVQIAKTGKFSDPRYGKFSITQNDFDKWIKNFEAKHYDGGELGLPIDIDHGPEKKGETEAVGWLKRIEKRDGGTTLWALAEWNDLGKQLVSDRRYAYISPTYTGNYEDEHGDKHGTALLGVALTNRPFLTMATVTLSKVSPVATEEFEDGTDHTLDTLEPMPDFKKIAIALGLPEDTDEATILTKLAERPQETEVKPVNLDTLAQEQGKVILSADQLQSLVADAQAGREASKTLAADKFDSAFKGAVDNGGVLPADEESYKTLYDVKPEETLKLLAAAAERGGKLNVDATGRTGAVDNTDLTVLGADMVDPLQQYGVDKDQAKVYNRAVALAAEKNIDFVEAVAMAESETR